MMGSSIKRLMWRWLETDIRRAQYRAWESGFYTGILHRGFFQERPKNPYREEKAND